MGKQIAENVRTVARHYDQFADTFDRKKSYAASGWKQPIPIMNIGYWATGATTARQAQEDFVRFAASHLPDLKTRQVLDVGCGLAGPASILATEYGAVVEGISIVEQQIDWARRFLAARGLDEQVHVRLGSAMDIPFPDESFDVVFSLEAAHCFADKARFLAEAGRVLRPGGKFLLIDITATRHELLVTWQPALKLRLITAEDWRRLFADRGFQIARTELIGQAIYPGFRRWLLRTAHERRQTIFNQICPADAGYPTRRIASVRAWVTEFALCRSVLPIGSWLRLREYALFLAEKPVLAGPG